MLCDGVDIDEIGDGSLKELCNMGCESTKYDEGFWRRVEEMVNEPDKVEDEVRRVMEELERKTKEIEDRIRKVRGLKVEGKKDYEDESGEEEDITSSTPEVGHAEEIKTTEKDEEDECTDVDRSSSTAPSTDDEGIKSQHSVCVDIMGTAESATPSPSPSVASSSTSSSKDRSGFGGGGRGVKRKGKDVVDVMRNMEGGELVALQALLGGGRDPGREG